MAFYYRVLWYGGPFLKKVGVQLGQNMDRAAIHLQRAVIQSFGSPQAYPDDYNLYNRVGDRISAKQFRKKQHSRPGEPPFVQTGHLRRSIKFDRPSTLTRRVGSTLRGSPHSYAFYLEMGTSIMAPRPYLRPTLAREQRNLLRIIAHGA